MNMNRIEALCQHRVGREVLATEFADIMEAERNGTAPPAGFDKALAYVVASIKQHDADGRARLSGRTREEWEQRLQDPPEAAGLAAVRVSATGRHRLPPISVYRPGQKGRRL